MSSQFKIFIFLLIISPFFWWQFINHNSPAKEYSKTFGYINNKVSHIFTDTRSIDQLRWNDTIQNRQLFGRIFFNKSYFIFDESIKYLNILNPRFYFQSGSGQNDLPSQIEPIAFLLIPTSFLGIFRFLKKKKYQIIPISLVCCLPSYLTGQLNIYFLFPMAIFYLYCSAYEISHWKKRSIYIFSTILFLYIIFLFLRAFYI